VLIDFAVHIHAIY